MTSYTHPTDHYAAVRRAWWRGLGQAIAYVAAGAIAMAAVLALAGRLS